MRRAAVGCVVAVGLLMPTAPLYADRSVTYPAYHTVQQGESLRGIADRFLRRATGKTPIARAVTNEMRQIKVLNRKTLNGSNQVQAGQRLLLAPSQWDVPDGRPGWSTGFTYCRNEKAAGVHSSPWTGLTFTVRVLNPPIHTKEAGIRLTVHNTSKRTRTFDTQREHGLLASDSYPSSAAIYGDAVAVAEFKLAPGQTRHIDTTVEASVCGDTRYLDRRLPAGSYELQGTAHWSSSNGQGRWVTEPISVRVVR